MKLSIATSFALAAPILAAYTSSDLPSCSLSCFATGAPEVGCDVNDQACLCENEDELTEKITSCVINSCSISDAFKTQEVSSGICEQLSSSSSASTSATASATSTGSVSSLTRTVAVTLTGTLVTSGTKTATVIPIVFNTTSIPTNGTLTAVTTPLTPSANSTASATSTRTTSADSSSSSGSDTSSASATSGSSASASSTAGASSFNEHGGFMASFVMMVVGVMMF